MAASPTNIYTGGGLQPSRTPEEAKTNSVRLPPGTYARGTVLGQLTALTAVNDVKTLTVTGTPTGGSFILNFNGQLSGSIPYNASAAAVQAILEAMPNIGTGNVVVAGGPLPGSTMTFTFQNAAGGLTQPSMVLAQNGLTGGTTPSASVANTTPGRSAGGQFKPYSNANADGSEVAKAILQYQTTVDTFGKHTLGGGEWGTGQGSTSAFFAGTFYTVDLPGIDAAAVTDLGRLVSGSNLADAGTELRLS